MLKAAGRIGPSTALRHASVAWQFSNARTARWDRPDQDPPACTEVRLSVAGSFRPERMRNDRISAAGFPIDPNK